MPSREENLDKTCQVLSVTKSDKSVYAASWSTSTDIRTPHEWPGQSLPLYSLSSYGITRIRGYLFTGLARLGT